MYEYQESVGRIKKRLTISNLEVTLSCDGAQVLNSSFSDGLVDMGCQDASYSCNSIPDIVALFLKSGS